MTGMKNQWQTSLCLLALGLLLFGTGCSTFNRDWKAAAQKPAPSNDITGAWDGRWLSERNGHRGRLQCILVKQDHNTYSARFKARFWKIFTARYTVPLQITAGTNNTFRLEGDNNLGKLAGGVYRYTGEATPQAFQSRYTNQYDHGIFEMKRPALE